MSDLSVQDIISKHDLNMEFDDAGNSIFTFRGPNKKLSPRKVMKVGADLAKAFKNAGAASTAYFMKGGTQYLIPSTEINSDVSQYIGSVILQEIGGCTKHSSFQIRLYHDGGDQNESWRKAMDEMKGPVLHHLQHELVPA